MKRYLFLFLATIALLVPAACAANTGRQSDVPAPTTHPFFTDAEDEAEVVPLGSAAVSPTANAETPPPVTLESAGAEEATRPATAAATADDRGEPAPTGEPAPSATSRPVITSSTFMTRTIFGDELNEHWSLQNSQWVTITHETEWVYDGTESLSFVPYEDFASLFFTVRQNKDVEYPRPLVYGVRFWLSGGDDYIELDDLAVTVVGSNQFSHWAPNDYSVRSSIEPVFSETHLEFLNLNQDIPPHEWVPVVLILNDLLYDPPYEYVTGFYIKNARGVLHPFYVDDVELIMVDEETGNGS